MKLLIILPFLFVSLTAQGFQLRKDSDFEWITGCEMDQDGFDYNLVYEDMIKKSNPERYKELIKDPTLKKKTFENIERFKRNGYLCFPIATLKFDLRMSGYEEEISGFNLDYKSITNVFTVENRDFRNLPITYHIELVDFMVPEIVTINKNMAYQTLQRCPEIKVDSHALLEVAFKFTRKKAGEYLGIPLSGKVSAYCSQLPDKKMELLTFKYTSDK